MALISCCDRWVRAVGVNHRQHSQKGASYVSETEKSTKSNIKAGKVAPSLHPESKDFSWLLSCEAVDWGTQSSQWWILNPSWICWVDPSLAQDQAQADTWGCQRVSAVAGQGDCTPRLTDPDRQSSAMRRGWRRFFSSHFLGRKRAFLIIIAQQLSNHFSRISRSFFLLTCTNKISDACENVWIGWSEWLL